MPASPASYLVLHLILRLSAKNCWQCLQNGGQFCLENNVCVSNSTAESLSGSECKRLVDLAINCPSIPALQYAYEDEFVRNTVLPVIAAAGSENPQECFNHQIPSMQLYKRRKVNCSSLFSDVTCVGYTGIDIARKVIALSVRGSHGSHQYYDLFKVGTFNGTVPFFGIGRVNKKFHDNFQSLWNGGLGEDLQILIDENPTFEIWVTGYSMGASIALIASAYIAQTGMSSPHNMKVILLGCPRCTDYEFALWHSMTFPYSYHIVHARDYAPRVPSFDNIDQIALYHPRTEVWYNNEMRDGDSFDICEQADQPFCSSQVQNLSTPDHLHYFNIDLMRWAGDGCPQNREDYKPKPETAEQISLDEMLNKELWKTSNNNKDLPV